MVICCLGGKVMEDYANVYISFFLILVLLLQDEGVAPHLYVELDFKEVLDFLISTHAVN
jgi:hypothetical protein